MQQHPQSLLDVSGVDLELGLGRVAAAAGSSSAAAGIPPKQRASVKGTSHHHSNNNHATHHLHPPHTTDPSAIAGPLSSSKTSSTKPKASQSLLTALTLPPPPTSATLSTETASSHRPSPGGGKSLLSTTATATQPLEDILAHPLVADPGSAFLSEPLIPDRLLSSRHSKARSSNAHGPAPLPTPAAVPPKKLVSHMPPSTAAQKKSPISPTTFPTAPTPILSTANQEDLLRFLEPAPASAATPPVGTKDSRSSKSARRASQRGEKLLATSPSKAAAPTSPPSTLPPTAAPTPVSPTLKEKSPVVKDALPGTAPATSSSSATSPAPSATLPAASAPQPPPVLDLKGMHPLSICSFNTFLLPYLFASNPSLLAGTNDKNVPPHLKNNTAARSERIADFCRGIHVCLLQEVWGPGVDALSTALSSTHSIPAALKPATKFPPLLADTLNTIAFYLSATGGLWLAYSRADGWTAAATTPDDPDLDSFAVVPANAAAGGEKQPRAYRPRYPPTKRPEPHLSLLPIPLTVPAARTFTVSATRSRKGIRAIFLDAGEFWGKGRRLLCFNTHLDAHDTVKRQRQLKEIASFIREVILSLSSLALDTHVQASGTRGRGSALSPDDPFSDDFDMLDEYAGFHFRGAGGSTSGAGGAAAGPPLSPPLSPRDRVGPPAAVPAAAVSSAADAYVPPSTEAQAVRYALPPLTPPHSLHHIREIAATTAVVVAGDLNIVAGSPEYRAALLRLMGPTSPALVDYFERRLGESEEEAARMGDGRPTFDPMRNALAGGEAAVAAAAAAGVASAAPAGGAASPGPRARKPSFDGGSGPTSPSRGNTVPPPGTLRTTQPARLDYLLGMEAVDVGGGEMVEFLRLRKVAGEVYDRDDMSDHWPVVGQFVPVEPGLGKGDAGGAKA
ncbi:hypothetical protein HDU96_010483 [Phlyctochytrium bullatum]|nr:hypothetical protein HDU96_010483 [Phlyctochytrium bullatum]